MHILKTNNNNELPIAFFDSGVGGLTVLNKLMKLLPNEKYIYYGDTLNMPYGEKTKEQLLAYSVKIFELFKKKRCKAVVMACNTTSSLIYDDLANLYNVKIYPVVQSMGEVLAKLNISRLGILATRATINSKAYEKAINKFNTDIQVYGQACPKWVSIVENDEIELEESKQQIKKDLEQMILFKPDKIVLGCTHYPYLLDILSEYVDRDRFIDPADSFAQYIKNDLCNLNLLNPCTKFYEPEVYVSSNPELFKKAAKMFLELKNTPILY